MSIELYWGSGSGPAWRAMLALKLKGIPFTGKQLSFSAGDTRSDDFRALNPRGKVPVLVEGDLVLNESLAILAYLDRRTPNPPLFGRDAAEAGQVWRAILEHENHVAPAFTAVYRPIFFGGWKDDPASLEGALPVARAEMATLAKNVARGCAVVGSELSAADLVYYISLRVMGRAATRPAAANFKMGYFPFAEHVPVLMPWAARIEAIPGFADTFPPHWREGENPTALNLE